MFRTTLIALAALATAPAAAEVVPTSSSPTAPICTDRPTKSNFACTVPKGAIQVEADAFNWLTTSNGGARFDQFLVTNPTLKYGLSDSSDIQVNWAPYVRARSRAADGSVAVQDGVGDLTLRFKQRLTPADGALQVALLPFIKLPTAPTGIGNGKVEGGLAVPINYSVPGGWTITLGPQLDVLADFDGDGRHLGLTGLVNIGKQFGAITVYNEIWTSQNFDPSGTFDQWSYDVAVAWLVTPTLQLDVGANIGLNRNTPDVVSYVGISARF
jgi:hypothetical protein